MKNKKIPEVLIKIAEDLKYLKNFYGININFPPAGTGTTGEQSNVMTIFPNDDLDSIQKQINEYLEVQTPRSQIAIIQGLFYEEINANAIT